jgi:phage terminase small subunit
VTNSTPSKAAPPPKGYTPAARALWVKVVEGWDIDPAALTILNVAGECLMRKDAAKAIVDKEGLTLTDRFGQARAHPMLAVERDARDGLLRALRQLGLDLEPLHDRPGRPGGR